MPTHTEDRARGHILTITTTEDHTADDPDYRWDVECLAPEKCDGWQECLEPHEVDGKSAASGPYDCDEDAPWCDEDEYEFHGVLHTWRWGNGWTVPFEGCVVSANDSTCDSVYDIAREHGAGRYQVDDDWDDETCYLTVIPESASVLA